MTEIVVLFEIITTVVFYEFVTKPKWKTVARYKLQCSGNSMGMNGSYCLSRLSLGTACRLVKPSELEFRMGPYRSYVVPICGENTRVVLESVSK